MTHRDIVARALMKIRIPFVRNADELPIAKEAYADADALLADLDKRGLCIVPKDAPARKPQRANSPDLHELYDVWKGR